MKLNENDIEVITTMHMHDVVEKWCDEYKVPKDRIPSIFVDCSLNKLTFGQTRYDWVLCPDGCYHLFCTLVINKYVARHSNWLIDSVTWHEFCHCECAIEDDECNKHDKYWRKKRARKPLFVLGDWVVKLLGPLL